MDILTNKRYFSYDYTSRYTNVPVYYNTVKKRDLFGIGTPMFKNTPYVSHTLKASDTLDSLALKYYNNPSYWWVIAAFNGILDSLVPLTNLGLVIKIPNISSIQFGDER